ncbi:MAG: Fe-S cluster assembly protein SufD [Cyclobacteriaceae bacterium]|nr:Fe-S cluster assembly protein SufD [Cyclobacteriaceae bacterium]
MSQSVELKNSTQEILSKITLEGTIRNQAREALGSLGLPASKNEEYKFAPVTRILEKNFNLSNFTVESSKVTDISSFAINYLDAHVLVMINGSFNKSLSSYDDRELKIELLNQESGKLGTLADYKTDALVAWNTAAWSAAIRLVVAENITVKKPVIIHQIIDTTNQEIKCFNRVLIEVGKSSELTVVEKLDTIGNQHNGFSNVVTEAFIEPNAELNYVSLQTDSSRRYHFSQTSIWQARDSRANCFTLTMDGKFIRNNLQVILDGEGCESHLLGLYLVQGDTLVDNHTVVDHKKANSFSNELYKGIVDDNARGVFNGKIFVRPNAQKTNAFQSNRNILLSDKATVNTKPQLEIWADDVKCSHGCTTGQLDEEALFYLRARGIGEDTARAMMLYAFAGEVIESLKSETIKSYIDSLISERLHKNF